MPVPVARTLSQIHTQIPWITSRRKPAAVHHCGGHRWSVRRGVALRPFDLVFFLSSFFASFLELNFFASHLADRISSSSSLVMHSLIVRARVCVYVRYNILFSFLFLRKQRHHISLLILMCNVYLWVFICISMWNWTGRNATLIETNDRTEFFVLFDFGMDSINVQASAQRKEEKKTPAQCRARAISESNKPEWMGQLKSESNLSAYACKITFDLD